MKTPLRPRDRGFCLFGIALIAALLGTPVAAQTTAPGVVAAGPVISLPPGWKVTGQSADLPVQPGQRSTSLDSNATSLVLTAEPVDPARKLSVSLFCTHFHDWTPPLVAGEPGLETETAKLVDAVLMQGYKPEDIQMQNSMSAKGKALTTIEVTAKNGAGEERVFSDTSPAVLPFGASIPRLYASRQAADAAGEQEIAAIIKSFDAPDEPRAQARNPAVPAPAASPPFEDIMGPPKQRIGSHPYATPSSNLFPPPGPPSMAQTLPRAANSPSPTPTPVPVGSSVSTLGGDSVVSGRAAELVSDYHSALLLVEGLKGLGSGFLCTMGGQTFAVTNAHVLADNVGVKLTSLNGAAFAAGASAVAVGHDIVRMEVRGAVTKAFEVMTNMDSNVKIGDAVLVPGNAEGASVVRPVEGKIVGIGPDLVEVDAPFVKGCSGSPIIHEATGKVLGIATYLLQRKMTDGDTKEVVVETRRFGYRLDSVATWEAINWQSFFAQSAQVAQIEGLS